MNTFLSNFIVITFFLTAAYAAEETSHPNVILMSHGDLESEREAGRKMQQKLQQAILSGEERFVIDSGTYRISPPSPDEPHISFREVEDMEVVGENVLIICETVNRALDLKDCRNLRITGITIDYDPLTMTQGTIVDLAPDGSWADLRIHEGYDAPAYNGKGVGHVWTCDPATGMIKPGTINRAMLKEISYRENRIWRLDFGVSLKDNTQVGDYLKLPQPLNLAAPHAVGLNGCHDIVFENITIHAAPCFAIKDQMGNGNAYLGVGIIPGSLPPGAEVPRLFSSSADAINITNCKRGPRVENCRIEACGDDGVAVYNHISPILSDSRDGKIRLAMQSRSPLFDNGDGLRLYGIDGSIDEFTVTGSREIPLPMDELKAVLDAFIARKSVNTFEKAYELTLDGKPEAQAGDMATNVEFDGKGFLIRGNSIRNTCSRGINVNMSRGTVESNRIEQTFLPAIHMIYTSRGNGFQRDVTIRGNRIADSPVANPSRDVWMGAIAITNQDMINRVPDGHRNIIIEDNEISRAVGVNLQVHCASGVVIRRNIFTQTHCIPPAAAQEKRVDGSAVIFLDNVTGVTLEQNQVIDPGPWCAPDPLIQTDECYQVKGRLGPGISPTAMDSYRVRTSD